MKSVRSIAALLLLAGFMGCKTQNAVIQQQPPTETIAADQPKSVDIHGEAFHYIEQGSGAPLIFVHGTLGDYRSWLSRMEPYSENYRVVSYSRRYAWPNEQQFDSLMDYSVRIHANDLYTLIQELDLEKVQLVGHSYGAYTALAMALEHPERVQSLILGEPPAASLIENSERGQESFDAFLANNLRPAAQAFRRDWNDQGLEHFMQGVMGDDFRLNHLPPEGKQRWMDNFLELWGFALTESFMRLDKTKIKQLEIPVLLIVGDHSPTWLVEISKALHQLLPRSKMVIIENSSHGLYFEQPEAVDRAIMDFLDRY